MIPKPMVVVSYADTSQNHHGYIYQATNFIYTGLSAKFKEPMVRGLEKMHSASIYDISKGQKNNFEWLRNHFGDNFYMRDRPQNHRYFYFAANKRYKKRMIKLLKYKIEAYPKGENKNYDASYNPSTQIQLF